MGLRPVLRALLSVSDKTGIVDFARNLSDRGIEILSTGGTAKALQEAGIQVISVDSYTGHPEIMDGRVKTLHPRIHGGILAVRDNPQHIQQMNDHGIKPIDMVVVNLYPFKKTIEKHEVTLEDAIENIDIGGPTMVRSSAKNHAYVTIVVDPCDYGTIIEELNSLGGISLETRKRCAVKAFRHTADYDATIDSYLSRTYLNENILRLSYSNGKELRYGENPHQGATYYTDALITEPSVGRAVQLHGKELSFNNIVDADAALEVIKEFSGLTAVSIIKHTNPCGCATGLSVAQALEAAWSGDPVSAFGGIIASSSIFDINAARFLEGRFVEIVIAPDFTSDAISFLQAKSSAIRLLKTGTFSHGEQEIRAFKHVTGGLLVQDRDLLLNETWKTVTTQQLPKSLKNCACFAWRVCKHVKSNAIVLVREYTPGYYKMEGMGAGQPNRIDSLRKLAVTKARENLKNEYTTSGRICPADGMFKEFGDMVLASDAFFPFPDAVEEAHSAGIRYIVQPGGSKRDNEVIDSCNKSGIAMIFTGTRHFRH